DREFVRQTMRGLWALPDLMAQLLEHNDAIRAVAARFADRSDFLYLGRGALYPLALEGALKLKEISYIHAEGYAAGEMKHGPIALIDRGMPVVAIATAGPTRDRMASSIEEVKARDGVVIVVANDDDEDMQARADVVLPVPAA